MNKILLIIVSLIILSSCASSDLDCNSDMVKKTVKDLLLESELQNGGDFSSMYSISKNDVEILFEEVIKISSVRTVAKNDELKSCDCKATLVFDINQEMKNDIKKINDNGFARMLMNGLVDEKGIEIIYNIQETADGEIYVETQEIENLDVNVTIYGLAYKEYMEKDQNEIEVNENKKEGFVENNQQTKENKSYTKGDVLKFQSKVNNGENKYKLTFLSDNKIDIEYTYFDFKDNVIAQFKNGIVNVDGDEETYILDNKTFKVFNPESQEYDIHYAQ
ncbi:hypothetical protein [Aequorivita lipolytica]|uniref:Uncharacterized protein n=1 Tax=Aequorivita lipolytica TaxID=153267 RepID=A0A5C6YLF0_9FLAO|nr:hypothetical protein [Aequorivita lipolytica]TXD67800.1 hypothetical protein ESV24_15020 [Aequorivita lipolytica]SRX54066.1 hypothetical protein AEQU2_03048 [Aequorivita lipolytica]